MFGESYPTLLMGIKMMLGEGDPEKVDPAQLKVIVGAVETEFDATELAEFEKEHAALQPDDQIVIDPETERPVGKSQELDDFYGFVADLI